MNKKSIFAAMAGTILEFYDFTLLNLFMPIIAPLFFPAKDSFSALMMAYGLLMIVILTRPLGGLFFGFIGDTYGRKKALMLSILIMSIPCVLTGLLPTYAQIGILAPILMGLFRAMQALCCGGEYSGAGLFVVEHAKIGQKGAQGSLLTASSLLGCFVASLIGLLATLDSVPEWGWRIPFILGGVVGIVGLFYRRQLKESPEFVQYQREEKKKDPHLMNFLKNNKASFLCSIGIGGISGVPFAIVCTYMLPVLKVKDVITKTELMTLNSFYMLFCVLVLYGAGKLSDTLGQSRLMKIGASWLFALAIPAIYAFNTSDLFDIILVHLALLAGNEIFLGPSNAFLCKLFPITCRYRGISFGFCLGLVLFGASTPFICANVTQWLEFEYLPAFWLMFVSAVAYLSVWYGEGIIRKRNHEEESSVVSFKRAA